MARGQRWEDDERGIGVGDARAWRPLIEELVGVSGEEGWVAEEPEAHLLPHLIAASAKGPLAIRRSSSQDDGTLEVDLVWVGPTDPGRAEIRSALFDLLAVVAETVTVIHEPPADGGRVLEALTGVRPGGAFATHGHMLRLRVALPETAPGAASE